ncbi:hypothetical protein [uncultured Robinsoniella sp.]|uniref:hypothetical protein n=1 Tax=uncultured Robinsoniella sp. TaxID=904190 RepID=UPI00374FB66E
MLIDDLQKSVKQLKQLDILESALQDAEKKVKNDSDYSVLVTDFWDLMEKISYASNEFEFVPSKESIQLVSDTIEKLESVISSGAVDEEELGTTKQQINRKVTPGIAKEWKAFHQKKTSGVVAKIASIGSLVKDQNKIETIRINVTNASDWPGLSLKDSGNNTRLELLKNGIEEVDKIEEELNLSEEVRNFVISVTRGKAKVTGITQNVIDWINEANLEDNFVIDFKK